LKIICIGRNYREHVKEMSSLLPENPLFFMKPDTALLKDGKPFFLPSFSDEIHHEIELVYRIDRLGKSIERKFAGRYYHYVTLGIDFTARDLQQAAKEKGLPWEISKSFDGSAALGTWVPLAELSQPQALEFRLEINGTVVQEGNSRDMIFPIDEVLSYVSGFVTLRTGDLFYTGTPAGVGSVKKGDHLQGFLENRLLLDFYIR
jgi:2-keto-4-pentenoate hydratase/2-oxohepta-3-ene-1,7-dioic acid hydratase in catechol pathway